MRRVKDVRTALQRLPLGLKETYDRIISNVSEVNRDILWQTLRWLSLNLSPMTIEELWEGIAIDVDSGDLDEDALLSRPEDVVEICGPLVRMSRSDSCISLAHLSVKEYFLASTLGSGKAKPSLTSRVAELHEEVALECLHYLSSAEFCSGPTDSEAAFDDRLARHPFLDYAARMWAYHALEAGQTDRVVASAMRFFASASRRSFMSWIQVLNADVAWDSYPRFATPLYYTASFGLDRIVSALILAHADVDEPGSRYGGTPLHGAVFREHVGVAGLLLAAGADPNIADDDEIYPLHTAAGWGDLQVIDVLLGAGARKTVTCRGETPYDWAVESNFPQAQELLLG